MAVVEFLMRNWYVVFIVIGILSWLRNAKFRTNANETPTNRMPSFGGQSAGRQPINRSKTLREPAGPLKAFKASDNQERTVSPFSVPPDFSAYSLKNEPTEDSEERHFTNVIPPDKKRLAQSIVWAEILGPPRSKKPFRK